MIRKMIKNYDYSLITITIGLSLFGLIMIYSAGYYASLKYNWGSNHFFVRQLLSLLLGLVVFSGALLFPYKAYKKLTKLMLLVTTFLLFLVFVMGKVVNNAQSWISIGGFNFQPSELAKLVIIIYLAYVLSKKQSYIDDFNRAIAPPLILVVFIAGLIFLQPDFGSMLILVSIAGVIIICSGVKLRHILFLAVSTVIFAAIFFLFFASDEQLSRIRGAYQPFKFRDDGYQLINSYIAVASGGLHGVGLGDGIQKLGYLPEVQTDFIIATVSEELGFIGVLCVIASFFYIVYKGFLLGVRCNDTFGRFLAIGISSMIGIQSIINLGGAIGLLPLTGVPLPFLSYGGSSLLVLLLSMGILINISAFVNMKKKEELVASPEPQYKKFMSRSLHS